MRKKKLIANTITSLFDEVVAMLCAFVLPKYFLTYYGSAVNGLVSSITQFLSFIAFLDLGVGAVVQSSLYKPIADDNNFEISKILKSARKFFRKIAAIFVVYVIVLIVLLPNLQSINYGFLYTAALILSIAITQFARYYFGIVNQLLLSASQKAYVQMTLHIMVLIINTLVCILLMKAGCSIQVVKLASSVVFLLRPFGMWIYVKKHYSIDYSIVYSEEPIRQKWNGLAQHITSVVLDNTDVTILTIFSSLNNVSIYSVYYLVVHGIRKIIERFTTGMQSLLGDVYVRNESENLRSIFDKFEFVIHSAVVFLFSCTGILLVPFVLLYTKNVTDTNYCAPLFGVILTLSQAIYCLRIPYNMMVKAAGHFKETQTSAIIEMSINLIVSIVTVIKFGLVGVAIGTLCSMIYRTSYLAIYAYKCLLKKNLINLVKQCIIDGIEVGTIIILTSMISLDTTTIIHWIEKGGVTGAISIATITIVTFFMRNDIWSMLAKRNKR